MINIIGLIGKNLDTGLPVLHLFAS